MKVVLDEDELAPARPRKALAEALNEEDDPTAN